MNNQRRIPRLLVRAFAAGSMLAAVALPMAVAETAGAATTPATLSGAYVVSSTKSLGTDALTATGTSGQSTVTITDTTATANVTFPAGAILVASGVPLGDYITSSVTTTTYSSVGPVAASATVTLATPLTGSVSGAANLYAPGLPTVGAGGGSLTVYVAGSGFAANGSTTTFGTNGVGVTFTNAAEAPGGMLASATLTTSATTTPGFFNLTVTDGFGASAALANAYQVNSAPTVSAVSPSTLLAGASNVTVSLTGTGFASGMTVTATSSVDGTKLTVGTVNVLTTTSATAVISAVNSATSGTPTAGTYTITVTNSTDGGSSTSAALLTVTAYGLVSASPSYIALPGASGAASTTTVTLSGVNLGTSGAVTMALGLTDHTAWLGVPTITNSSITVPVTVPASWNTAGQMNFTFTNTNGASTTLSGAVGLGQASTAAGNAPTITSVGSVGTLGIGSAATVVITGTNFVPTGVSGSSTAAFDVAGTSTSSGLNCSTTNVVSTTQLICTINSSAITTSTIAGAQDLYITSGSLTSAAYANALTIAGPVITAVSPAVLGIGSAVTSLALTGTGFPTTGTTTVTVTGISGTKSILVNSATSATVTISSGSVTASAVTVQISSTVTSQSPVFSLSAGSPVTVSSFTYPGTNTGVGQGASGVTVTVNGSGFLPGATVTFPTGSGLSATVVSVISTAIIVKVSATATATSAAATVTNSNGGTGVSGVNLTVHAGPSGTTSISASPSASITAGVTATLTLSPGTSGAFATGVAVTSSTSLLTVGTVVLNANGTLSVPLTAAAMSGGNVIGTTLTVTNPDGGTGTLSVSINPAMTIAGTYYVPTFSKNVQVVITGAGFQTGMTASSSSADYTVVLGAVNPAVAPSTVSTAILVVTTTSNATAGTSSTITFTNPDGGKVTFPLNGGPVPTPTPVLTQPHVTGVSTFVKTGMTRAITLTGLHFMKGLTIHSVAGTTWKVMGVSPTAVRVQVTVTKASHVGWHRLFLTNPNGKSTSRAYQQK